MYTYMLMLPLKARQTLAEKYTHNHVTVISVEVIIFYYILGYTYGLVILSSRLGKTEKNSDFRYTLILDNGKMQQKRNLRKNNKNLTVIKMSIMASQNC
jgi:uncharacterized membrane protein YcaP (DUF421 family)